jgi:hypothetical protein
MMRLRLPLLALGVAALVAVVALVAHGRPLAASSGKGGLSTTFWDYTATSAVIVFALVALAVASVLYVGVRNRETSWNPPSHTRSLVQVLALGFIGGLLFLLFRLIHRNNGTSAQLHGGGSRNVKHGKPVPPHTWFRWQELAIVLGVLLLVGLIVFAVNRRRRGGMVPEWTPAAVAAALDASLDDLRDDPDLRRAIIAAYARMETALAASGVPRWPAEAPLEYLERALLALDTSQASVRRLTDLFEWARFSHHEPEPAMRDDAVDALEAVRDELRAPAAVAA